MTLSLPDLGTIRILPGERCVRLPRPAAGRHGPGCLATSAMTTANTRCAPQEGNSSKATCSIGGCPTRVKVCARESRRSGVARLCTVAHLMCAATADAAVLDEDIAFLEGQLLRLRGARQLFPPDVIR